MDVEWNNNNFFNIFLQVEVDSLAKNSDLLFVNCVKHCYYVIIFVKDFFKYVTLMGLNMKEWMNVWNTWWHKKLSANLPQPHFQRLCITLKAIKMWIVTLLRSTSFYFNLEVNNL